MTEKSQNLAQQVQEQTRSLVQQLQKQVLRSAEDFYGNSLGSLKSRLENDRAQLQDLLEQLPESQAAIRAQIEQFVASYETIENSIDEAIQQEGGEEAVSWAVRQAQDIAGKGTGQAQETAAQATQEAQDAVVLAAEIAEKEPNATKAAIRKAEKLGIDLSEIAGSGGEGRITLNDVVKAARR